MTFSLLVRDPETGALGGAAATGNLCVGGWVLRGRTGLGLSASQGHSPSTLWGETVLDEIAKHSAPDHAVETTVAPDAGRAYRQLLVLNQAGQGSAFTGSSNVPEVAELIAPDLCAGGNMLTKASVVEAAAHGIATGSGGLMRKLLKGLQAGASEGGDLRGLQSAAILIVSVDHPPIDLRVDFAPDPLDRLADLIERVEAPDYTRWMQTLPTQVAPYSKS